MWLNPQFPADLVTFTEDILNGKLYFLCSVIYAVQNNVTTKCKQALHMCLLRII